MILGVDHLTLNNSAIESAKKNLEENGFKCIFIERDILNHPSKKHLLEQYQSTHDIALFKPEKGVSIEVINHGNVTSVESPYYYHGDFIELKTSHIKKEMAFWKSVFCFSELTSDTLGLRSPVPHWNCTIKFCEQADLRLSTLDSKGYTCLAFLTNNISQDIEFIKSTGAFDITSLFKITVNARELEIAMFRTPTGTLCELIQIRSSKNG